jgi:methyl-accepting chemotaxis protein
MKSKSKLTLILMSFSVVPLLIFYAGIYLFSIDNTILIGQVNKILFITLCIIIVFLVSTSAVVHKKLFTYVEKITRFTNKSLENDFSNDAYASKYDKSSNTSRELDNSLSKIKEVSVELGNTAPYLEAVSKEMVTSVDEVSESINNVAEGSNSQANEIVDVVNLLTNLTNEISMVQRRLYEVNENSVDTESKAVEGENKIYELINFIVKIKQSFDVVIEKINGLSTTVSEIGKITDIINGISKQTNLLALNASIEATRAGEQGKGFTVVASEVRKLAEGSKESSEKIINLVKSITLETEEVMENSIKVGSLLEEQAVVANDTIISFEDIIDSVKNVPQLITMTEKSLNSVVDNNRLILYKVQNISEVAQEISAASEEISASSQSLLKSSEEVSNLSHKINEYSYGLAREIDIFKL